MTKKYYIYKITNTLSDKIYIGQSVEPKRRWKTHQRLSKNQKTNQYIHHAMNKYGVDNFTFKVISEYESLEECNSAEAKYIEESNSQNKELGYNIKPGGREKGWQHTEETKAKQSANWHKIHSPESLKKMHDANIGRKHSEETIKKMSETHKANLHSGNFEKGYQPSEETKQRRRETFDENYGSKVCNAPNCERTDGSKVDDIRYCDMHEQRMRKYGTLELQERVAHNKGKPLSDETKRKLSAALKGRKVHNRIEFTQDQIDLIMSYTMSGEALAEKLNVSRNVIKRVRKENKY
jgi:group I intron endonuclease